jgi:PAS domain S-box-containing protein
MYIGEHHKMISELRELKRLTEKLVTKDEQLSDRVKQWRYVFDAIKDVVVIINTEFKVVFVNRAFHIHMIDPDIPFLGRKCYEILCESSNLSVNEIKHACEESFSNNEAMELYISIFNGVYRYDRSPIIDDNANTLGYIIVLKNVDKLHEVEARNEDILRTLLTERNKFKKLLEITPTLLLELDKNGKIYFSNQEVSEILGISTDKLKGLDWFDNFLPEEEKVRVKEVFNKILSSELDTSDKIYNMVLNKKGEKIPVCWRNSVVKDIEGNVISILVAGEILESTEINLKQCNSVYF